ncbi:MAG: hypothetical protein JWQ42_4092 [Edaphobacter sp.]|nr:hypothetical protein [Edaphobacter sp.]
MGILKGFPKSVGRVESRLYGFPCFPYSVVSMACLVKLPKSPFFVHISREFYASVITLWPSLEGFSRRQL